MHFPNRFRALFCALGFLALSLTAACATTPRVATAELAQAETVRFESPYQFSSRASGCRYARQSVRRKALNSCDARGLTVDPDSCSCATRAGSGGKVGCTIEAKVACN